MFLLCVFVHTRGPGGRGAVRHLHPTSTGPMSFSGGGGGRDSLTLTPDQDKLSLGYTESGLGYPLAGTGVKTGYCWTGYTTGSTLLAVYHRRTFLLQLKV